MTLRTATLLLALAVPAAAAAQIGDPPCTPADGRLDGALARWSRPAVQAGAVVAAGEPVRVTLEPVERVGFALPPERAPAPGSRAATVAIEAPSAGRYRLALSGPVWVDVVAGTRRLASAAHGHGPRCATIRKIVDFDLPAGRHLVQLSGSPAREVTLLLVAPEPHSPETTRR